MSIKEVTMYQAICDGCGASAQEGDFYAWADADQAETEAECGEWLAGDGKHWCTGCIVQDDDGEMTPTPEALTAAQQRQETERARLTGNLGGNPDLDPGAVLADDRA